MQDSNLKNHRCLVRRKVAAWCAALLLLLLSTMPPTTMLAADERDSGPLNLLITYRCASAGRPAFREYLAKNGLAQFEQWKREGVIQEYRILFNWYVDADAWDAMAILKFHEYADVARWRAIEKNSPGGLSKEALTLATPIHTYSADAAWQGASETGKGDSKESVFFVIPYELLVPLPDYKTYVDGYVIPQIKGWLKEGVLASYHIYLNRYATGKPWDALFVLEYKDLNAFGLRESTTAKVRAALRDNPAWKTLADGKQKIRNELETVIADALITNR
ncbi:MAG: hypothetical protein ACREEM_31165 [Blastocatellia bacterium]